MMLFLTTQTKEMICNKKKKKKTHQVQQEHLIAFHPCKCIFNSLVIQRYN